MTRGDDARIPTGIDVRPWNSGTVGWTTDAGSGKIGAVVRGFVLARPGPDNHYRRKRLLRGALVDRIEDSGALLIVAEDEVDEETRVVGFVDVDLDGNGMLRWLHVDPDAGGGGSVPD